MDDSSRNGESKLALKWNIYPTKRSWNSDHHDLDAADDDDEIKTVFFPKFCHVAKVAIIQKKV
jgi:hypothetical protein